jgi:hypothetical protein
MTVGQPGFNHDFRLEESHTRVQEHRGIVFNRPVLSVTERSRLVRRRELGAESLEFTRPEPPVFVRHITDDSTDQVSRIFDDRCRLLHISKGSETRPTSIDPTGVGRGDPLLPIASLAPASLQSLTNVRIRSSIIGVLARVTASLPFR